jgi:hypothetical protein
MVFPCGLARQCPRETQNCLVRTRPQEKFREAPPHDQLPMSRARTLYESFGDSADGGNVDRRERDFSHRSEAGMMNSGASIQAECNVGNGVERPIRRWSHNSKRQRTNRRRPYNGKLGSSRVAQCVSLSGRALGASLPEPLRPFRLMVNVQQRASPPIRVTIPDAGAAQVRHADSSGRTHCPACCLRRQLCWRSCGRAALCAVGQSSTALPARFTERAPSSLLFRSARLAPCGFEPRRNAGRWQL